MRRGKKARADLTAERARELLSYDPWSGVLTRRRAGPGALRAGRRADTIINHGYRFVSIGDFNFAAHRVAWLLVHGDWPKAEIDHVNGLRADNRLVNLRDVPKYINGHNRGPSRTSASGIKGVCATGDGTWSASIQVNRLRRHLGTFKTKEAAADAYRAAADLHLGLALAG